VQAVRAALQFQTRIKKLTATEPLRQSQRRPRAGVFRGRRDGEPDHGPLTPQRRFRHRSAHRIHLQRQSG
jgi:hypothetical protein